MKITEVTAAGLQGGTLAEGWTNDIKPSDCVHTLVEVKSDEGVHREKVYPGTAPRAGQCSDVKQQSRPDRHEPVRISAEVRIRDLQKLS